MSLFGDRLRDALKVRNVTQKDLADALGVKYKTINSYVNGLANPPMTNLADIARYLNISTDYLVGIIQEPKSIQKSEDPFSSDILMIRRSYGTMTEEQRKAIISLVQSIVNK